MIRFGIYNLDQLINRDLKDFFSKEKNISIYLYKEINKLKDINLKEEYSELVLNRFNSYSNIIKRTYRNRYNSFDDTVIGLILKQNYPVLRLHDLAISDGRASVYFAEKVLRTFKNLEYSASDLSISYTVLKKCLDSKSYMISDSSNKIIEITVPPFVWNYARKEGTLYFINNLLKSFYLKRYSKLIAEHKFSCIEYLNLIDNEFNVLTRGNNNFKIFNYSLFEKMPANYNVIRAMNILHYGYFNPEDIDKILTNIFDALSFGGLFIEGSNENADSEVEGSIFRRTQNGFELVISLKKPSRILNSVLLYSKK